MCMLLVGNYERGWKEFEWRWKSSIYAGIAGIALMQEIGIADTREHVQGLNAHLLDGLDELQANVVTPPVGQGRRRGWACTSQQ